MAQPDEGYTLVELVVVILIFAIVTTLISVSFNRIVATSTQITKSGETDIGGLIGLELLRCDLELAGFGLPWSLPSSLTYSEADDVVFVEGCPDGCPKAKASLLNDGSVAPPSSPPRAYAVGDNVGLNGSDYLVLKGSALGMNATSRRWSYLNYSSVSAVVKPSKSQVELTTGHHDRVIVVKAGVAANGAPYRDLVTQGSSFSLVFDEPLPDAFRPAGKEDTHLIYGVALPATDHLRFPFNRADYYLSRMGEKLNKKSPYVSPNCAPKTAVLYKSTIDHGGGHSEYPLLDCVADMQVILYLDTNKDGDPDYYPDLSEATVSAEELREQLKEIRVYILAQQGKKDAAYFYPISDPNKVFQVGDPDPKVDPLRGRVWKESQLNDTFGSEWRHYHWKVYTISVRPKNL